MRSKEFYTADIGILLILLNKVFIYEFSNQLNSPFNSQIAGDDEFRTAAKAKAKDFDTYHFL